MKTKKGISDLDKIIEKFRPQHEPLQCLPACLMNIHNELFSRKDKEEKISLNDVSEICGYKKGLGSNEYFLVEKINEKIKPLNYEAKEEYSIKDGLKFLEKILLSKELSFPVVTLSGDYFEDITSIRGPSSRRIGHSIIVMGIDKEYIIYYEPAENFISSAYPNPNNPRRMMKPRFQKLWDDFEDPNWVLWYEPRKTRTLQEFLEEDDERKTKYHIERYRKG